MFFRKALTIAFTAALAPAAALAQPEFRPVLEEFYASALASLASDAALIAAIQARNAETSGHDPAMIAALDAAWIAEIGTQDMPTVTPILQNPTSDFLRAQVEAAGGRITEIFVMDAEGLNVAASSVTSDMWQGDEAKFTETFGIGPGAVHYSDVELDESTNRYQAQISFTVIDPATNTPIGAVTVGVDAESLL